MLLNNACELKEKHFGLKKFGNNYLTNNLIIFQKKKNVNTIRLKIIFGTTPPPPHIFDSRIDFILNQFCKQLVLNLHSPHTKKIFFSDALAKFASLLRIGCFHQFQRK